MIERILIVGLGSIGKRHLKIARNCFPHSDIRILRHSIVEDTATQSNGNLFSFEEVLRFKPQIAVIANPAPYHLEIATLLITTGTHILIEKPISTSSIGVLELVTLGNFAKLIMMTGYNLRYLKSLSTFRQILNENLIGEILSVRSDVGLDLKKWRPESDYRESVSASSILGGGVLLELSHEIDYLRWIFGEVDWVRATLTRQSNLEIDVEDTGHITLGFEAKGNKKQLIASLNIDMIRQDPLRTCVAIGEKGSLRWNGLSGEVEKYSTNSKVWETLFAQNPNVDESYEAEWNDFIACISNGKKPLVTGEDGLKVLLIIEAIRASSLSGSHAEVQRGIAITSDNNE